MYKEKIYDVITNEETWRDYSDNEIAQVEAAQAQALEREAEVQAKEAARQAVLSKLGLTAEEAKLLVS